MSEMKQRKRLMPSKRTVRKLRTTEWQVSSFMMDRTLEAVVRQTRNNRIYWHYLLR